MNDSIYRINLDIHTVGSQVFLPVKRGDTARTILIRLTEDYKSYQIADGCSARFCGKKPDGNYLYNDCTISGGIITYNLTSQTTACEGVVECEIQLFDANGKQITSPRFSLVVDGTVYNGEDIASTPEADALKELTDRAERVLDDLGGAIPNIDVTEVSDGVEITVTSKDGIETAKVYNGQDGKDGKDVDYSLVANALKGSASGKVVVIKDVSPLEHTVKVKLDGDNIGGEVLTKTERFDTKYQDVMLNNASKSVRVVMFGDSHCVGGVIPLVDGQDLTQLNDFSSFAIVPVGNYAEVGGIRDITYKIEGNTLKWEGFGGAWYQDEIYERFDISGEYTLSSSGQNIIGFCEAYGLDEDNPNYMASEYDNLRIDISIYEGNAATVKVFGKNYFDISKVVTNVPLGLGRVINNNDGTLTIKTQSQLSTAGAKPSTLRDYAPDLKVGETYYLSAYSTPVEGASYADNYIYLDGTGANLTWFFNSAKKITEAMLNATVRWYAWGKTNATTTISNIQIEKGKTATEYEPYIKPTEYTTDANGEAKIPSMCPTMTIIPDTDVDMSVEYNRDINKAFAELQAAIISMGGNV